MAVQVHALFPLRRLRNFVSTNDFTNASIVLLAAGCRRTEALRSRFRRFFTHPTELDGLARGAGKLHQLCLSKSREEMALYQPIATQHRCMQLHSDITLHP